MRKARCLKETCLLFTLANLRFMCVDNVFASTPSVPCWRRESENLNESPLSWGFIFCL